MNVAVVPSTSCPACHARHDCTHACMQLHAAEGIYILPVRTGSHELAAFADGHALNSCGSG
jgi:hypothetical protein